MLFFASKDDDLERGPVLPLLYPSLYWNQRDCHTGVLPAQAVSWLGRKCRKVLASALQDQRGLASLQMCRAAGQKVMGSDAWLCPVDRGHVEMQPSSFGESLVEPDCPFVRELAAQIAIVAMRNTRA